MRQSFLSLALIAWTIINISACSKTEVPKTYYYTIDTLETQQAPPRDGMQIVQVNTVTLPAYLDQRNLVMRDGDSQIIISQYHLWADEPAAGITRQLTNSLNALDSARHYQSRCSDCPSVNVNIEHFYPTSDGEVVLTGEYTLGGGNDSNHPFSFRSQLKSDGYEDAVRVMRVLIKDLAQQIDAETIVNPIMANDG